VKFAKGLPETFVAALAIQRFSNQSSPRAVQ
jgi:hypothetical protein